MIIAKYFGYYFSEKNNLLDANEVIITLLARYFFLTLPDNLA